MKLTLPGSIQAAALLKDVVALIRALITASAVAGFDETTLRSGPAGWYVTAKL